jgi:RNA polymerase sigma-70 factor (ECF subfamily)
MQASAAALTPPMSGAQGDLDLVQRHCYGDEGAFEEVYQRYAEMVYNLALRLSGDADQAADLSQEIFLRIYRHLERFRGRSTLKTWVYRVALNHCRSRLGRKRWWHWPLREETDGEEGVQLLDEQRDPESRAIADDAGRRVLAALRQVPEPFREAVILCDLQELSYQEIAEILGVRVGTVRSRISRGRDRLRDILEASETKP